MKNTLLIVLFSILSNSLYAGNSVDSIFTELDYTIENKQQYVQQKQERIVFIKKLITNDLPLLQKYHFNENLCHEYEKFNSDSAIYYAKTNRQIADALGKKDLSYAAQIQLTTLYSSSGMYRESESLLKNINSKRLSKELLSNYYEAYREFFEHYAINNRRNIYIQQIETYRDSLLIVLSPSSLKYQINLAEKNIYHRHIDTAEGNLLRLFRQVDKDNPDYAMIAYLLGRIYQEKQDTESAKKYYALSAIADIKNSIKDNASIQILALIYYDAGDIDKAYKFTQSAIEDAVFCNVQFRTIQMSEFYSIINTAYLDKEAKRKGQLQLYLLLISILSIFLILAVAYVYKQMKKVSGIRGELYTTNQKLVVLNNDICKTNDQLQERNVQLSESNHIKEEYIAHFFDLCSAYINKLEDYRKTLNKKATSKQFDELFKMLKSTTVVENELEELYRNFDNIFLNLYPTFVEDFNSLLFGEEQVMLKPGELLNTELRIFALIRLGITDSVKIAAFLRYSLSTIYNYRTKARNKAAVSRDEFEKMVMKIGAIPRKMN
ncbi:DUF6377 domain-containing protein [uncultured Bacteroides sp.]|uniref:DUF6377 domain-containing protein n=1 Tax=uncultured Bacteroides sp. TaxID=162156 RepID=UPI002AA5FCC9|nr:DUF6377 domain-containing protein [uncultured Bacteroides sp.]